MKIREYNGYYHVLRARLSNLRLTSNNDLRLPNRGVRTNDALLRHYLCADAKGRLFNLFRPVVAWARLGLSAVIGVFFRDTWFPSLFNAIKRDGLYHH